eukprot:scaffold3873_cov177-Ochromonas_danica.AAC.6
MKLFHSKDNRVLPPEPPSSWLCDKSTLFHIKSSRIDSMTDGQLSNVMTPPYSISTVKRRIGKYMLHRLCVIGCTERDGMDESQDRVILTEDQSNDCRCWNILLCINLIELSADCRTLSQVREQVHEMSKRQTNRKRKAKSLFHA